MVPVIPTSGTPGIPRHRDMKHPTRRSEAEKSGRLIVWQLIRYVLIYANSGDCVQPSRAMSSCGREARYPEQNSCSMSGQRGGTGVWQVVVSTDRPLRVTPIRTSLSPMSHSLEPVGRFWYNLAVILLVPNLHAQPFYSSQHLGYSGRSQRLRRVQRRATLAIPVSWMRRTVWMSGTGSSGGQSVRRADGGSHLPADRRRSAHPD